MHVCFADAHPGIEYLNTVHVFQVRKESTNREVSSKDGPEQGQTVQTRRIRDVLAEEVAKRAQTEAPLNVASPVFLLNPSSGGMAGVEACAYLMDVGEADVHDIVDDGSVKLGGEAGTARDG